MKRVFQIIMIAFIAMFVSMGCQKKVTKVETPPLPPPPPEVVVPQPPPPPVEFTPVDIAVNITIKQVQ